MAVPIFVHFVAAVAANLDFVLIAVVHHTLVAFPTLDDSVENMASPGFGLVVDTVFVLVAVPTMLCFVW